MLKHTALEAHGRCDLIENRYGSFGYLGHNFGSFREWCVTKVSKSQMHLIGWHMSQMVLADLFWLPGGGLQLDLLDEILPDWVLFDTCQSKRDYAHHSK